MADHQPLPHNMSLTPHLKPELERFRPWLGQWRGAGQFAGKIPAIIEITFTPQFEGDVLEVHSASWDAENGQCLSNGLGYWSVGPDGKVAASIYAPGMGGVMMQEVPDDPSGVCIEGMLPGNVRFTVALIAEGPTLTLTARRTEGYSNSGESMTTGVMRRMTAPGVSDDS
jgi:hypothetical protein